MFILFIPKILKRLLCVPLFWDRTLLPLFPLGICLTAYGYNHIN
jgi:hypothetical protein